VEDRLAEIRELFDPAPGPIYLDTATYGLPPRSTVEAMHRAVSDWQTGSANWVQDWDTRGEACRAAFAQLINVSPDTVALIPTVSVGVGMIAASLTEHDEVLVADDEFLSVLFPFLVAARDRGAHLRVVPFDQLADNVAPTTTLVAFSLVQSQSGRGARQTEVIDAAQRVGARTLIDATHALPFVSVDPRADFVACAAYKHLLCPRGVGFLYVSKGQWESVAPWLANWRSAHDPYGVHYGGDLDLATGAARFDVSLAWFSWVGAAVSLELLVDWQRRGLLAEPVALAGRLAAAVDVPEPPGSVVSVPVEDAEKVRTHLAALGVKAAVRAGSVRLSTHVYNTRENVDRAVEALAPFLTRTETAIR
jgi:selenocysteine lyase/cysteine desulfurase